MRQQYVYRSLRSAWLRADMQQGHIVTLEITSGEVYRGKLIEGALGVLPRNFDPLLTECS